MRLRHMPMFLVLALNALGASGISHAAEVGDRVPGCQAKALDGSGAIDLAGRTDKVVYIDFWASWCGPCAASFPFLDQLHSELKPRGFEVIGVNLDEDAADAQAFLRKHPVGFTLVGDPEGRCPRVYGVKVMPSSYLVDGQGVIRQVHLGFKAGDKETIRQQVLMLLDGARGKAR